MLSTYIDAFPQIPIICARVTIKFHPSITITRLIVCVFYLFLLFRYVRYVFLFLHCVCSIWYFYFILSSCFVFTRINKKKQLSYCRYISALFFPNMPPMLAMYCANTGKQRISSPEHIELIQKDKVRKTKTQSDKSK